MEPNWANLNTRAKASAQEFMPSLPTENTLEAWEAFAEALEALDPSEFAHAEADSWDWVIYYGQAMQLCTQVPSSVLHEAEAMMQDAGGVNDVFESAGLYGVACQCAYWIVFQIVFDLMEEARLELLELADAQVQSFEGVAA